MTLYLFRHASVEEAYRGCYNGHIDIDASLKGLQEAKKHFKEIEDRAFDKVYCSTLKRAKQTIETFKIEQKVHYLDVLREKSWGRHEGKSYDEVVAMEAVSYENFTQWMAVLDGQNYKDFIEDIRFFLDNILAEKEGNILIVCHAGVIYTIIHILENIPLEEAFLKNIKYGNYYLLQEN